jgi:hypothetical protein
MSVPITTLCRKPDDEGAFNPRCQHILLPSDPKSRAPDGPRQCRRAAVKDARFCDAHPNNKAA